MRNLFFGAIIALLASVASMATAQQTAWIQLEAQRNLSRAETVARGYSGSLQQVNGFAMRSGWYAIALGPFTPSDAADTLRQLRITRQIPGDAYVVDGSSYKSQFWPIGASALNAQPTAPTITTDVQPAVVQPIVPSEETVAEARRSERGLDQAARMLLQTALKWDGHYNSAIDGAIGPGTRKAMASWQEREGREVTGVLNTIQRHDLVSEYQQMQASLSIAPVRDNATGISINLPTAMVAFDRYEPPFAHFNSKDDTGSQVLLISQTGDEATLRGLYDIMQTLEIVPLGGPRNIDTNSFTLTGENNAISSYTYAALADGQVKGFTVIWPAGADKRRSLVINEMKNSFAPFSDAVLPDVYGDPNAAQSLDLLAGLSIRQPDISRSGFFVDSTGAVLTTAEAVQSCERITLDGDTTMQLAATDTASGIALLRPENALAPIGYAQLSTIQPRLNSEISVSGYSYAGILGAPTMTFGTLADLKGLNGDTTVKRLALDATEADAGGPVFDTSGSVMGLLLPSTSSDGKRLPTGVRFAADSSALADFLLAQGVENLPSATAAAIAPEDLTIRAADMTVLISCWN